MAKKVPKGKASLLGGKGRGGKRRTRPKSSAGSASAVVRRVHSMTDHFLSLARAMAAAAGPQRVTFRCSNPAAVLVTVSTHVGAVLLNPEASLDMASGQNDIVWAARGTGGAGFEVGVTGGRFNLPIKGPLPVSGEDGGPRVLTVP